MGDDNRADDLTKEGMLKGVEQAAAFILVSGLAQYLSSSALINTSLSCSFGSLEFDRHQFLSTGVLERPYCQMEIRHALALKKQMVLLHGEP